MLRLSDVLQPKPEERVVAVVRRHGITLLPRLIIAGFWMVVPFFFLFALTKIGTFGIVIFVLCLSIGLFLALRTFLLWDSDVLLITSHRLVDVDQNGLWNRTVSETPLRSVQEIVCERKGIGEMICHMGTLRIRTSGVTPELVASKVSRPERFQQLIRELQDTTPEPEDRLAKIQALLPKVSEEMLAKVEALLRS